ncbi:MAG: helix-turn-helix domain-containing protein [Pseudonocardiaceae bacterium]
MNANTARYCRSCKTRRARDNRGDVCAACTAKALAGPPPVPPTFWDHAEIRNALDRWHMGAVISAYRNHPFHGRPLRQETVASWVGLTQAQLSRIENGPAIKDLDKLIRWATLLGMPAQLLWFQLPTPRGVDSAMSPPNGVEALPMPLPSLPAAGPFQLVRVGSHAGRANGSDAAAMQSFRSADRQVGGGHLYATVVGYLHSDVAPRLFGGDCDADSRTVFTAAAGLTEMAGWMAHDAGRDDQAHRHFGRALDMSRVGQDRQLGVHVLTSMSHLAHHRSQPHDAIRFAQAGENTLAKGPRNPELEACVFAMQARGLAALRRPREALTLLARAEKALEGTHDEEPFTWVSHFDEGSLASEAARCMQQLGKPAHVRRHAERIIELRPAGRTRSRAFGQLILIMALIEQGEPEQACALAREVLDSTQSLGSYLVIQQLHDIQRLLEPYSATGVVREFLGCLAEALHQRIWLYQWLTKDAHDYPPGSTR